jgi:hypothetical protein
MPTFSSKPAQLPEDIGMYVDMLRKRCPSIDEVWLVGPRANGSEQRNEDWDLLAFGDGPALRDLRSDDALHRDNVNLIIVTDGDRYERVWGDRSSGSLSTLEWQRRDPQSATYVGQDGPFRTHAGRAAAVRVR